MTTANTAVEGAIAQGVQEVQANGVKIRSGIENGGSKVNEVVQQQIVNAKSTVEKTTADLHNKIKDSLDKLERLFG